MFLTKFDATQPWWQMFGGEKSPQRNLVQLDPGLPGCDAPHEMASRDQLLLVLEGEVLAEVAEEKARMVPGTAVVIPAGVAYRFMNGGLSRVRSVTLSAPQSGLNDFS